MSRNRTELIHVQWQGEQKHYNVNVASYMPEDPNEAYYFRTMKYDTERELMEAFPDLDITREQLFLAQLAAKGTVFKREEK